MLLRAFVLFIAGLYGCAALNAQTLPPCIAYGGAGSTCTVGSSISFDFGQFLQLDQLASLLNGSSSSDGITFTFSFAPGGTLPPGLSLSPNGLLSGTFTAAGQFELNLTVNYTFAIPSINYKQSYSFPITLELTVASYSGPSATVAPTGLNFNLTQNGAGVTQSVTVSNFGNQAVQFSASAKTNSGRNWLQLSSTGGSVASFGSSPLSVTADPSQLTAGTYSGTVTISVAGEPALAVTVVAVVTATQPSIQITQTGLTFEAVSGGTATSPQTITVINQGAGTLDFTASVSTISGGDWLIVSPSSGSSSASGSGSVTVSVNPAGLQPATYYGKVQISASGAANSPQVASVVLNVVSPANSPGASVTPTGVIFVGSAGGADPAAQNVSITNPSPDALSFLVTPFSNNASNWLAATPTSGSVSSTQPATLSVQPTLQGLAPGIYIGDLAVTIVNPTATSTATPQIFHIEVLLLVLPSGESPSIRSGLRPHASTCAPTQLLPVFTLLGTGFSATVGWPTAIEVTVVDDCGNPLLSGSVTVTFSSGDPALSLTSLNDGSWTATWNATHVASSVTITALAQEVQPAALTGTASIGGALSPNDATPSVSSGGVVSAVSFVPNQPLAPGAYAAIFGANLSKGLAGSNKLPLSTQLENTTVVLSGEQLPLLFASGGQINAVVPYDVPVNSTQQLVVQNGSAISIPQPVVIAPALPAIITQNETGTGVALYAAFTSKAQLPNNSPVSAGDLVVLYCSGLGAVKPAVAAGSMTPLSPLSYTVNPVTVSFGGKQVQASFAGLAPLYAQLYQVNVVVPSGLPSGSVPVTLSVGGQQSSPVTITVK
jgi:uncharacterized protein (TIGR03437 family)